MVVAVLRSTLQHKFSSIVCIFVRFIFGPRWETTPQRSPSLGTENDQLVDGEAPFVVRTDSAGGRRAVIKSGVRLVVLGFSERTFLCASPVD